VSRALTVRLEAGEGCTALFDERWDALVRRQPLPNPTLASAWLERLVEWEDGVPVAVTAETDGALVGAAAFGLHSVAGRVGPRLVRWLGDHRQWFSCDVLVEPGLDEAGEAILDAVLGLAHGLHLPAPAGGPCARALRALAPWAAVVGGAEGWVASLPPPRWERVVHHYERDVRRARRNGAIVTERVATAPDDVAGALERLFDLHAARWKVKGGEIPRFSTSERHRDWYRRVVAAMAERGQALIAEVLEDGALVGSELGFLAGRGSVFHTTAIRQGTALEEPGHACQTILLEAIREKGVEAVDLGLGAGEPGSPKASIGPTRIVTERLLAASSPRRQRALAALMRLRTATRRGRAG
jgi:CelD/BcsL family acetyltransferase involved in cellulose biosynthesis